MSAQAPKSWPPPACKTPARRVLLGGCFLGHKTMEEGGANQNDSAAQAAEVSVAEDTSERGEAAKMVKVIETLVRERLGSGSARDAARLCTGNPPGAAGRLLVVSQPAP